MYRAQAVQALPVGRLPQAKGVEMFARTAAAFVLALCFASVLAGSGTGASAPRPLPTTGETPLVAGTYATSEFAPAFAFSTAGGWRVEHDATHDTYFFYGSGCCGQHADSRTGALMFFQPAQADPEAWFRSNPHVKSGPASSVTIGGEHGTGFTVSFRSATKDGGDCANLLPNTAGSDGPFSLCPGDHAVVAFITADGKPVVVVTQAIPADTGWFARRAQAFLRTVRFDPGTARAPAPRTLILGESDPVYDADVYFAQQVSRLSHGTLQVSIHPQLYGDSPNNEQLVVRALEHGKLDLARDATRVWDKVGVTSYEALQAPFLIDNLPLFRRVVDGSIPAEVATGTRKIGVVGLGVEAVNLRRPFGAKKPFLSVQDFRGAKINVLASALSERVMRALGATPVEVGGGGNLADALKKGDANAAETAIDVVLSNGYAASVGKYMTTNVVFYPKPASIDASARVFAKLTPFQQQVLRRAARATAAYSIDVLAEQQNQDARALCKNGQRFATASAQDLAGLAAAEQPVYRQLERSTLTARVIGQIRALKRTTPAGSPLSIPGSCRASG
jgi:TRAP-type C4-dicarboxylate transport system substrate-binding protein